MPKKSAAAVVVAPEEEETQQPETVAQDDKTEQQDTVAAEEPEAEPDAPDYDIITILAAATLTGDIRDAILDRIKNLRKPWEQMVAHEKRELVLGIESFTRKLVRDAVHLISSEGRKTITGHLEQVTVKKEIKAVITLPKSDECRHELIDSQGQAVLIVVAGTEAFEGEQSPVKIPKDQLDLVDNLEEGRDGDGAESVPTDGADQPENSHNTEEGQTDGPSDDVDDFDSNFAAA